MRHRKLFIISGMILVLLIAVLYIYIYTIPEITGALTKTCIVEYGEMKIEKKVSAVIVRDEVVYRAGSSGKPSYYVDNNTKTRKEIKILDIYGTGNESVICPWTGVVSYYYDGYESILTPGAVANVYNLIPTGASIEVKNLKCEKIKEGEPLYKLISSDSFYTVFKASPEDISSYTQGSKVSLEFDTGTVSAKISEIIPVYAESETADAGALQSDSGYDSESQDSLASASSEDLYKLVKGADPESETGNSETDSEASETPEAEIIEYIVVISTSKYFKDYDKLRCCDVSIVLQDDKGLIVPNSAIANVDGSDGVYVKGIDGEYDFTRIKIINSDGTNSVVYSDSFSVLRDDGLTDTISTISIYDEILKDASKQN